MSAMALAAALLLSGQPTLSYGQVYRCGNAYSATPCPGNQVVGLQPLTTTPATTVAPSPRPSKARNPAQREAQEREQTERALDKAQARVAPQRDGAKNRAACQAASRRIEKIDALARKGGSPQKMEQLKEERQDARDWQFSAGC